MTFGTRRCIRYTLVLVIEKALDYNEKDLTNNEEKEGDYDRMVE
jgi:hypothetical protein